MLLVALTALLCGCAFAPVETEEPVIEMVPVTAEPTAVPAPPTPTPMPTPEPTKTPYTIAWLGDTQSYASTYPEQFLAMTEWMVQNQDALGIQYVIHTGDIVNQPEIQAEWDAAQAALTRLSGALPLFAIAGNHDQLGVLNETGQDYTPYTRLMETLARSGVDMPGWHDEGWRRRYDLVTIGGEPFLLIGVGYKLSLADYDWLNEVLADHADCTAILIAHYYLDFDGVPRGEGYQLYRKVVMKNPNVQYVLCGHRHRVQHQVQALDVDFDRAVDRTAYALMNDYQGYENGGGGYLVLLTFDPEKRELRVTSYSPVLDDFNYFEDETVETYTLPYPD